MGTIGYRRYRESDSLVTSMLEDAIRCQREKVETKTRAMNEQAKAEGKPQKAVVWKPAKKRVEPRADGLEDVVLEQDYEVK